MDYLAALYIDPGTGGMLFTILFGLFGVVVFSMRALMMRLKFMPGSWFIMSGDPHDPANWKYPGN